MRILIWRLVLQHHTVKPREHSAIRSTFIWLPFVFKTFVLSNFKWPLKTGFTVLLFQRKTAEIHYMFSLEGIRERFPTLMMPQDTTGSKVDAKKTNGRGHNGSSP